jgi:hypothetical protein
LRRRLPELVSPCRQFTKVTKAGHLFSRSSVLSQPGGALELKTDVDFSRQPLVQNPLLAAVYLEDNVAIIAIIESKPDCVLAVALKVNLP